MARSYSSAAKSPGAAAPDGESPPARAAIERFAPGFVVLGCLFALLAAAAIVIGLHDVALADANLAVTVTSVVLIAFAVTALVAAYQLLGLSRRTTWIDGTRPACKPPVLVALLFLLIAGLYAFVSGIRAAGDQRLFVVAVGVALVSVALIGLVVFGSEVRVTAPRLGAVILGMVGATVTAWQFWYQNEYAPSQAGRAIALSARLTKDATQRDAYIVRAVVRFEAVSGRSLTVVGSAYTLTAARLVSCDRRERADVAEVAQVFNGFLIDPQRSRFTADVREQQPSTLLVAGKFVGDGRRLEPEVPHAREIVFHVPRGRYQLLRLRAQMFAISGAVDLSQQKPPQYELAPNGYLYGFWQVDDDSWLRDLLYGRERWLVTRYELVRKPGDAKAYADQRVTARLTEASWDGGRPTLAEAASLFTTLRLTDPAEPFATTELALDPLARPTADDALPRACRR
jgi:hypothetical protein